MKSKRRTKKKKDHHAQVRSAADDLKEITRNELSGSEDNDSSLSLSSTDEDEDEGLGDGKIGRSKDDILGRD